MKLQQRILATLSVLLLSFCTYGDVEDGIENQQYAFQFLLNNVSGQLNADWRFSDESTDSIHTFSTAAGNIELTTLNLHFESVELVYNDGPLEGIVRFLYNPVNHSALYAHGEEEVVGQKRFQTEPFVFRLASNTQTQTDVAGISYQVASVEQSVPAGTVNSLIFHLQSVETAGMRNGSAFASVLNEKLDVSLVLKCPFSVRNSQSVRNVIQWNFSKLFESGTNSDSIRNGLDSTSILREPECFVF